VIQPSSDSHINFEVWLPTSGWNGNFMGIGNGGAAGSIIYDGSLVGTSAPGLAQALKDGFATAGTDAGHQGRMDVTPSVVNIQNGESIITTGRFMKQP
jgi:feruloyl esterase